ncbi:Premnaspirodiene oxygenase [Sesamum alatum]|uniref:Premnaspirodiene oxygenase n=1 Tax=Sesamum alatum TaxID=300844 RepID=A0AAE1YQP3_9LAMI|nr:Premnaspirodiene oxygenase [Sesamum alatum]
MVTPGSCILSHLVLLYKTNVQKKSGDYASDHYLLAKMELGIPIFFNMISLILIVPLLYLVNRFHTSRSSRPKLPPGPWKLPLIGSLHHLLGGSLPHHALRNLARKYGPIMHLQLGEISAVLISAPRVAKELLTTHDLAFLSRPRLPSLGIMTYNYQDIAMAPYGDYWKQMRKICFSELLSSKNVHSFSTIREEEAVNLVESIRSHPSSIPIDLTQKVFSCTNDVVCRAAFGKSRGGKDEFLPLIIEFGTSSGGFDVADLFPSVKFLGVVTGMRTKLMKLHHKIDQVLSVIIDEHVEKLTLGQHAEEDLVDVLLRFKQKGSLEFPITMDNIKAITLDMFTAGTYTTATTVEFAMAQMIKHPNVMEKAQAELRHVFKGKDRILDSDLEKVSYLKMVIKETLRLNPPAPLLLPKECQDWQKVCGYDIPPKTEVILNALAIHRDPEYWDNAESFEPERFAESGIEFIGPNFEFIPFGGGRRMCPGTYFSLATVELLLAQLLYHFNWELPDGLKPQDLDMTEIVGFVAKRKNNLCLLATSL